MADSLTVRELILRATTELAETSPSPKLDAQLLLQHILGWSKTDMLVRDREAISEANQIRFEHLLQRRKQHEPVAYLVGCKEFFGRDFIVSPAVLCPRPETELLVECTLESVASRRSVSFIDLGTGSGCIAISVAAELCARGISCQGLAVEQSEAALHVARQNAACHLQSGILSFLHSNWFEAVHREARFDLVLSNPPYVEVGAGFSPELVHEPSEALYAGVDGMSEYRKIFSSLENFITEGALALFEIGSSQGPALHSLAREVLRSACHISVKKDLSGHDRVLQIRF